MLSTPKKQALFILGITALVFSRAMFLFFNDPEGPNLLVVMVTAVIVYCVSLAIYPLSSSIQDSKKFWLAILLQILVVIGLYIFGKG